MSFGNTKVSSSYFVFYCPLFSFAQIWFIYLISLLQKLNKFNLSAIYENVLIGKYLCKFALFQGPHITWKTKMYCKTDIEKKSFLSFFFLADWSFVVFLIRVVIFWLRLWDQTPHISKSWICLEINSLTPDWRFFLLNYRIPSVNLRNCGKITYKLS